MGVEAKLDKFFLTTTLVMDKIDTLNKYCLDCLDTHISKELEKRVFNGKSYKGIEVK